MNMRYFKSQHITLDHGDEEHEINHALHDDCIGGLDGEARDLHAHLLEDDELEGVAEGLSASFDVVRSMLHAFMG